MRHASCSISLGLALALALTACGAPGEETSLIDDVGADTSAIVPSPPFLGDAANQAVFAVDVSFWEGPLAQREIDCFWESGVRHLVAGTQVEEITRQQLAMAVSRGMTVDAYVYLYWDRDLVAQVAEAFRRTQGFPIGRLWLDVEENPGPLGANTLVKLLQQAVDACVAQGTVTCGIYTGPGFWKSAMNDTPAFASLPLWYAWYNKGTTLSDWTKEHFGGWAQPQAKQWAEQALCGVGVDKNVMQVALSPTVVVDRSVPADDQLPPPPPSNPYPADGSTVTLDVAKLMVATIPHATQYQFALEVWAQTHFKTYYTWTRNDPFLKTYPPRNAVYRFRARARDVSGWGEWSSWSTFDYGVYAGPRPGATPQQPPTPPPAQPPAQPPVQPPAQPPAQPPVQPPAAAGAPTGLTPDGATLSTPSVKLACDPLPGATRYEFTIEVQTASATSFAPYVSYQTTSPSKVFYPQVHKATYRWRVHALVAGSYGAWSNLASFQYP